VKVITDLLPVKRDNLGHPVILISISMVDFLEALCDFGSSVNIMPRVPYEKFFTHPLSETTMGLQLADRTLSFPKGILKNLCIRVGRPFLNTSGAVIYASAAKISFYIKGRTETFSFKNKTTQILERSQHEPRKWTNKRKRNKKMWTKSAKMVTIAQGGQDRLLKSPFLIKKDDPGVPSIECTINGYSFEKTLRHRI